MIKLNLLAVSDQRRGREKIELEKFGFLSYQGVVLPRNVVGSQGS
jgi:hypothetical protein